MLMNFFDVTYIFVEENFQKKHFSLIANENIVPVNGNKILKIVGHDNHHLHGHVSYYFLSTNVM